MKAPMPSELNQLIQNNTLPLLHRLRPAQGGTKNSPCLILLHGVGANETGLMDIAARQDPDLTVILARGPLSFGPNQFGWFQVSFTANGPVINPAQAEQARRTLLDFIAALPAAHGIDPDRIWLAGFSQGGIMSASVGLTEPKAIRGFGLWSGRILPEIAALMADPDALKMQHAFVSHGVHDSKLPIALGRNSHSLLSAHKVQTVYREYPADHEFTPAMQADFTAWLAAQMKHADSDANA
jgi:phospholipase/carboxylesterase